MDFNQTALTYLLEVQKIYEILVILSPLTWSQEVKNIEKCLVSTLSPEWMDRFNHTCIETWNRFGQILVTLASFSRSKEIKEC